MALRGGNRNIVPNPTQTADVAGMGGVLQPNASLTVDQLIMYARKTKQFIQTEYDLWRYMTNSVVTVTSANDMVTGFNNTYNEYILEFFPASFVNASKEQLALFKQSVASMELNTAQYTTTVRLAPEFGVGLCSVREANGRKLGPQYPQSTNVTIIDGSATLFIKKIANGALAGYALQNDTSVPQALDNTVVIRNNISGVAFEIGLYKNNELIGDYAIDATGRELSFVLPETYCVICYSVYCQNDEYVEAARTTVQPGQIVFIQETGNSTIELVTRSNKNLLAIPSRKELGIIELAGERNPNY